LVISDYIELDAGWDAANHIVPAVCTQHRDIPPGEYELTPSPGATMSIGSHNQNFFIDRLIVAPYLLAASRV
jgi:hypothetical protein